MDLGERLRQPFFEQECQIAAAVSMKSFDECLEITFGLVKFLTPEVIDHATNIFIRFPDQILVEIPAYLRDPLFSGCSHRFFRGTSVQKQQESFPIFRGTK
jgi:hypothetical protein